MADEAKIALQIEMQAALPSEQGGGRGVVFRTFVDRDCSHAELDKVLDKLRLAVDRQNAFAEVEKWQGSLEDAERIGAEHAARLEIVQENVQRKWAEGNRRGDARLTPSEEGERRQAHANLENAKQSVLHCQKRLAHYQGRLNGRVI
jgi:hypothetical protein